MTEVNSVDLLVTGKWLVTVDQEHRIIENGGLAVKGNTIVETGTAEQLAATYTATEHIEAPSAVIMPGLINGHTHFGDSLFRSLVGDMALEPWLQKLWAAEAKFVNPDSVYLAVQLALAESIRGGTTAALDMFWHYDQAARAATEAGFKLLTGPVFLDIGMPYDITDADVTAFFEQYQDHRLITPVIQPHGTYTVGPEQLTSTYAYAEKYDALYHIHASETRTEVGIVQDKYGKTPITQLDEYDLLGERTVLAHAVHVDADERTLIAERGARVVHNPVCNCKLGSGIAPIPQMLALGIPVALGTDGPVSSNDLDLWTHMRFAATIHRGVSEDPLAIKTDDVLAMATRGGAEALRLDDTGSLEAGKRADFIIVSTNKPHLAPIYNLYSHLLYSVGRADVDTVVIDGKVVMRERELLTLNEEKILAEIAELEPKIAAFIAQM